MVEEQDVDLPSSHKYSKSTSLSGTIHTEQLLSASRRPQTSKRQKNFNVARQDKRKKREKGMETGLAPQGGRCGRKISPPWEVPSPAGRSTQMEGELQSLGGRVQQLVIVEGPAQMVHTSALCTLADMLIYWCGEARCQSSAFRVRPREGLAVQRQPEEAGEWQLCVHSEEAGACQRQDTIVGQGVHVRREARPPQELCFLNLGSQATRHHLT